MARQQLLGSRSGAPSWPQAQFEPDVCSCQGSDRRLREQGQERVGPGKVRGCKAGRGEHSLKERGSPQLGQGRGPWGQRLSLSGGVLQVMQTEGVVGQVS